MSLKNYQNLLFAQTRANLVQASHKKARVPIEPKIVNPLKIEIIEVNHLFFDYGTEK